MARARAPRDADAAEALRAHRWANSHAPRAPRRHADESYGGRVGRGGRQTSGRGTIERASEWSRNFCGRAWRSTRPPGRQQRGRACGWPASTDEHKFAQPQSNARIHDRDHRSGRVQRRTRKTQLLKRRV